MMPHKRHIYATSYDMPITTICEYPPYQHVLPHWKCVLRYCYNLQRIYLPHQ